MTSMRKSPYPTETALARPSHLRFISAAAAVCVSGLLGACGGGNSAGVDLSSANSTEQAVASTNSPANNSDDFDDVVKEGEALPGDICSNPPADVSVFEPTASKLNASADARTMAMPSDHVAMVAAKAKWTVVAAKSGAWNDPDTWGGAVPKNGDSVRIPANTVVSVENQESASLARIYVEGILKFSTNQDTRLIVDTMLVGANAEVHMGSLTQALQPGVSAEIVIQSRAEAPLDVADKTRGILVSGRFVTNGPRRDNMAALTGNATKGSNSLQFNTAPVGWAVGDEIVVTGTRFHWSNSQSETLLENEVRKITAINGNTVTLDSKLVYDHVKADPSFSIFVSNLTRPVVVRSASKALAERGHVMFMKGSVARIHDAAFIDLGRTNKAAAPSTTNVKGVYSVHFHQNGYDEEQQFDNSVIRGTPGWGLVNHSSNVVATKNVVHDFVGAAFSSEAGDEIGSFTGNIVSGGTQRPLQVKPYAREAVGKAQRERLMVGDMGKFANGFWMVSPQVVVQNNVVAGGNGTAYLMFSLGTVEFGPDQPKGQFTGFPLDRVPAGVVPRTWNYPNQFTGAKMAVTADLPIKDFKNNIAYGVFQGMRVRWTADDSGFMYSSGRGVNVAQFQTTPSNLRRQRFVLRDLTFWNVGSGMSVGYSENHDIDNLTVVNAPDYDSACSINMCGPYGFSTDGDRGMDTKITNSRISGGKTAPINLAKQIKTQNLYIDGKLYTAK